MASTVEEVGTDARPSVEVRLYLLDAKGFAVDAGSLELCAHPPPQPQDQARAVVDHGAAGVALHGAATGIYLTVREGADIKDVAHLAFLEGRPACGTGPGVKVEAGEKGTGETGKVDVAGNDTGMRREQEADRNSGKSEEEAALSDGFEKTEEETVSDGNVYTSKDEDAEKAGNHTVHEGSKEEEEEKTVESKEYSVNLQIWPSSNRASLVLFNNGYWKLTREYSVLWLQPSEKENFLAKITTEGIRSTLNTSTQASSIWTRYFMGRLNFQGALVHSQDLQDYIDSEMTPSVLDFEVTKLLGKGSTCCVHQCFYHDANSTGDQYAIKVMMITDFDVWNGKEPRPGQLLEISQTICMIITHLLMTSKYTGTGI